MDGSPKQKLDTKSQIQSDLIIRMFTASENLNFFFENLNACQDFDLIDSLKI